MPVNTTMSGGYRENCPRLYNKWQTQNVNPGRTLVINYKATLPTHSSIYGFISSVFHCQIVKMEHTHARVYTSSFKTAQSSDSG